MAGTKASYMARRRALNKQGGAAQATPKNPAEALVGQSVTELEKYARWNGGEGDENIRKDFGLERATEKQLDALRAMFRGMMEHDKQYGDDKAPFNIEAIHIEMLGERKSQEDIDRERVLYGRKRPDNPVISVLVITRPNSGNSYIDYLDTKDRQALLGKNGGWYTYSNGAKLSKKKVDSFDMIYGKHH